ncbi:MAG TPA: PRC-barrel domain-containing protein [Sphingobacteriaceae bacterium]
MEAYENKHLKELGHSKFEVAPGQSDIRGWVVKNEQGRILGRVDDLVIDTESEKVKYLVVDLDGNEMQLRDRKVLLPLNVAQLNEPSNNVIYPGTMANELAAIPTHEKGRFYSRTEELIHDAFSARGERSDVSGSIGGMTSGETAHSFITEERPAQQERPVGYASEGWDSTNKEQKHQDRPKPQDQPLKYASTGPDVNRPLIDESAGHEGITPSSGRKQTNAGGEQRKSDRVYTSPPQMPEGKNESSEPSAMADNDRSSSSERSISHASIGRIMPETTRSSAMQQRKTVVGIFDHTNQAQSAAGYLEREGFPREDIDISLRDADDYDTSRQGEDRHSGITDFFSSLFEDNDKAQNYTDAAKTCSVVTLTCESSEDAERAAQILDNHGAVNIDDRYEAHRHSDTDTFTLGDREKRKYHSLIVDSPDQSKVRGLR